jgi:hypothetical protein
LWQKDTSTIGMQRHFDLRQSTNSLTLMTREEEDIRHHHGNISATRSLLLFFLSTTGVWRRLGFVCVLARQPGSVSPFFFLCSPCHEVLVFLYRQGVPSGLGAYKFVSILLPAKYLACLKYSRTSYGLQFFISFRTYRDSLVCHGMFACTCSRSASM